MIPLDDCEEQIINNYNLQMRCKEFRRALEKYDMNDVFSILQFPADVDVDKLLTSSKPIQSLPETLDILE